MINKSLIDKLLEMPDDKLLVTLRIILSSSGVETSGKNLSKLDQATIRKVRRVLAEVTDADIERVNHLTEVYKKGD